MCYILKKTYYNRLVQYAEATETPEIYFKLFLDIQRNATKKLFTS